MTYSKCRPPRPQWRLAANTREVMSWYFKFCKTHSVFLAATKQLYEWFSPSVRLSVCLSVTPFSLCSRHCIITKFSGVITNDKSDVHAISQGQRSKVKVTEVKKIVEFDPDWAFPDCKSSLNSSMATKWWTKLEVAWKRCPIVFQGHPSNFKVTRL